MTKDHVSYNFSFRPAQKDPALERYNTMTPEERFADFMEAPYLPTVGVSPGVGAVLPCPVDITLGVDKDGRLAVTALHIDAAKHKTVVTATGLRQVGNMITDLLRRIAAPEAREEDEAYIMLGPLLKGLAVPHEGVAVRPGRRGYLPEQYREWALTYREAVAADEDHPYTWLARKWHYSESQARRRVQRARELFPELFEEVDG